jgi:hypothetical protein
MLGGEMGYRTLNYELDGHVAVLTYNPSNATPSPGR